MRIALYSPDRLFGEALSLLIQYQGHYQEVNLVRSAVAALAETDSDIPTVILADVDGLSTADVELLGQARERRGFGLILLTRRHPDTYLHIGASRVLNLSDSAAQLFTILSELSDTPSAQIPASHRVGVYRDHRDLRLSRREFEVAQLVAQGLSNRRIANVTGLREQSIKNLVSVVMRKLDCDNRVQVALKLVHAKVDQTSGAA